MTKRTGFETGPDSATISASHTAGGADDALRQLFPGATWVYDATAAAHGSFAAKATNQASNSAVSGVELGDSAASSATARAYFTLDADATGSPVAPPTAGSLGLQIRSTTDGRIVTGYIDNAMKLRLAASGGDIGGAVSAAAISTSVARIRLTLTVDQIGASTTDATCKAYDGDTGTVLATVTATNFTASGTTDRCRAGKNGTSVMANYAVDDFEFTTGSAVEIGVPSISASPAAGVAEATGEVPWETTPGGISLSLEQQNPVAGTGLAAALDALLIQLDGPIVTGAGAAYDSAVTLSQSASAAATAAAGTGAATDSAVQVVVVLPKEGTLSLLMAAWFAAHSGVGASLADLEFSYFASVSGLTPAAQHSLVTHKRAFYAAQLSLTLAQAASTSITGLEIAYWQSVDPGNSVGSWAERARRWYST